MLSRNSTSFLINNMSTTYTHQKFYSAPTHFLVNTGFSKSLYKTICFGHTIKAYIPIPRGLHQSINGSSRGRQTLIVVLLSTKLELSQKVFDKYKVLTRMRVSHSYLCLSLSESGQQLPHFMKSGKRMSKLHSLMDLLKKSCI